MHTADCLNIPIKIFLALFAVYAILLMFVYNMQVPETRPRKNEYGVKRNNKYILQWTNKSKAPFNFMDSGNSAFIKNKCKYTNCYITDNATGINQTDFDAIAFNGRDVIKMNISQLPTSRSPKQKYIFGATESADRFPVCDKIFDSFFNWTWTYKLDSNLRWGYITIYDKMGQEIGPAIDMKWPERMDPVSEELKLKLSQKSKTAAWFVSHCHTDSKREDFVDDVNKELKKYKRHVDIYGSCGSLKCPGSECTKMVNEYYFYFAFENSFAEDYVTEKLLTALNNNAVPIVFGSANYSRFLPDGSYLDGRKLGAKKLARVMNELIANKSRYYEFFRWRNHFSYALTTENQDICKLCEALNNEHLVKTVSVWKDFRKWWNGGSYKHCQ